MDSITTLDEAIAKAKQLCDLISDTLPASIYQAHPNDLAVELASQAISEEESQRVPLEWDTWWQWSGDREDAWRTLVETSNRISTSDGLGGYGLSTSDELNSVRSGIPAAVIQLLVGAKALSLPRQPCAIEMTAQVRNSLSPKGMSPKKFHEVSRMTAYVFDLLDDLEEQHHIKVRHIVDVGAGQGHLSRTLCSIRNVHVLALDSSRHHVERSAYRFQRSESKGTLTHRTVWLGEQPTFETHPACQGPDQESATNLKEIIDQWIRGSHVGTQTNPDGDTLEGPVPVIIVALHACGALTPEVLRELLNQRCNNSMTKRPWYVTAAVVVGCCYNLMRKEDFPLSRAVKHYTEQHHPDFGLSPSHLQLASQVPSQWLGENEVSTELALKSIVFRALITPFLAVSLGQNTDRTDIPKLGKFNVKAHESFENYLCRVGDKLQLDLSSYYDKITADKEGRRRFIHRLTSHIKVLHALRCILGPPVESLIILDRYLWLQEELGGREILDVRLVNLFDQSQSARNVAIVLAPRIGAD